MSSFRNRVFTLFDVSPEAKKLLDDLPNVLRMVYQLEKCPKEGKLHFQGYVEFIKPQPFKSLKAKFPTIHLESRKGTAMDNYIYCTKTESREQGPFIKGKWDDVQKKKKQGARNDLQITPLIDDIKLGLSHKELSIKYYNIFMKYNKAFNDYYEMFKPARGPEIKLQLYGWQIDMMQIFNAPPKHRQIIWIWSKASETGKTIFKQYCQQFFHVLDINNFVFKDIIHVYNDEPIIWINLPRGDILDLTKINVLEKLSDGGYCQSTKYQGSRKYINSHIVITSNSEPPYDLLPKRILGVCVDKPDVLPDVIAEW